MVDVLAQFTMKTKTEKDFVSWIRENIKYYVPILGLELHEIEIEASEDQYMGMKCTYPYLDPILWYSKKSFKDWTEGKLKKDRILHELCHILTDPFYCKAISRYVSENEIRDEREKLTDTFAAIIRKLL